MKRSIRSPRHASVCLLAILWGSCVIPMTGCSSGIDEVDDLMDKLKFLDFISAEMLVIFLSALMLLITVIWLMTKKKHTMIPTMEYYAPDGLNPAEVGYIIDGYVTPNDMTSLIYYWASHGHLSINATGENTFTLKRLSELDSDHTDYERKLYNDMWYLGSMYTKKQGKGSRSYSIIPEEDDLRIGGRSSKVSSKQLARGFSRPVQKAYKSLRAGFDRSERRIFELSRSRAAAAIPGVMLCIAILLPFLQFVNQLGMSFFVVSILSAIFIGLVLAIRMGSVVIWFVTAPLSLAVIFIVACVQNNFTVSFYPCLGALMYYLASGLFERGFTYKRLHRKSSIAYTVTAYIINTLATFFYCLCFVGTNISFYAVLIFAVCTFACIAICPHIRNYTEEGARLVARCEGFKQFLLTAEKDRLEMLIADDPDYYYSILPYAHVLGVSGVWAEKTADINVELPGWFSGEYGSFNSITSTMMNTLDSISGIFKKGTRKRRRS